MCPSHVADQEEAAISGPPGIHEIQDQAQALAPQAVSIHPLPQLTLAWPAEYHCPSSRLAGRMSC